MVVSGLKDHPHPVRISFHLAETKMSNDIKGQMHLVRSMLETSLQATSLDLTVEQSEARLMLESLWGFHMADSEWADCILEYDKFRPGLSLRARTPMGRA